MMRAENFSPVRVLLALAAVSLPICCTKPNNPREERFAAADFEIKISETRQTGAFEYSYDKTLGCLAIDPEVQTLQELWITEWNETVMELSSGDPLFEGANIRSGSPDVVAVRKIDPGRALLEYVSDGTATITVWNSDEYRYSFTVHSKDVIELEYITIGCDDLSGHREIRLSLRPYFKVSTYQAFDTFGYTEDTCHIRVNTEYLKFCQGYAPIRVQKYYEGFPGKSKYCQQVKDGAVFTIGKLYPENASWRCVDIEASECGSAVTSGLNSRCEALGWPEYMKSRESFKSQLEEFGLDWSMAEGRKALVLKTVNARRDRSGKLTDWVPYVFAAKVYTRYGKKQPERNKAEIMFAYCLPVSSEQCDFPPTRDNPVNKEWQGYESGDWFDEQFWKYEY